MALLQGLLPFAMDEPEVIKTQRILRKRKASTTVRKQEATCKRLSEPKRSCSTDGRLQRPVNKRSETVMEAFAAPKRPVTVSVLERKKETPSERKSSQTKTEANLKSISNTQKKNEKTLPRKSTSQSVKSGGSQLKPNAKSKSSPAPAARRSRTLPAQREVSKKVEQAKDELVQKVLDLKETRTSSDEQHELLKSIVEQAERDRKIFCSFERRKHIIQPIRDELLKRGWVEYFPPQVNARATVPQSTPAPVPTLGYRTAVNHTTLSIADLLLKRRTHFHASPPNFMRWPSRENEIIMNFGERFGGQMALISVIRAEPRRMQENPEEISQIIQSQDREISYVILSAKPRRQLRYLPAVPPIGNKFQHNTFCSKFGLWQNLNNRKNLIPALGVQYPVKYPRMYNLADPSEEAIFSTDFKMTAVVGLLRWFVENARNTQDSIYGQYGTITTDVIDTAVKIAKLITAYCKTGASSTEEKFNNFPDWGMFLSLYHKIIHERRKLRAASLQNLAPLLLKAELALKEIKQVQPLRDPDGWDNLWILKPYSSACGRGIFLTNNLTYIQNLADKQFIIQKYIERPFLIEDTKFDIRQWILLTSLNPLEFWIYKDCYLRFSAVQYDKKNLHESIHLTNNAIQQFYAENVGLPHQNMWDSAAFKKYLEILKMPNLWQTKIFPAMRDALKCTLMCSQHTFDEAKPERKGWYELYGADFMLTSDLSSGPWLIEINEGPALAPSSPVTSALCDQMLRDIVKVVVDRTDDGITNTDTGGWILAYRQPESPQPESEKA